MKKVSLNEILAGIIEEKIGAGFRHGNGWDVVDDSFDDDDNDFETVDYLDVPKGETKIRVVDESPHAYEEYWVVKANGGKGSSVPFKGKEDLLEAENQAYIDKHMPAAKAVKNKDDRKKAMRKVYQGVPYKRRKKFAINVIDRKTGTIKVLDKGLGVFKELKKFADNPDYGDLRQYDITLVRKGDGMQTEYSVVPARSNEPLTEAEEKMVAESRFDIAKAKSSDHITPEQCLKLAKGATWQEIFAENEEAEQPATSEDSSQEEPAKDEAVTTEDDGLTEDDLKDVSFE